MFLLIRLFKQSGSGHMSCSLIHHILPALLGELQCGSLCKLLHAEICPSCWSKLAQSLRSHHQKQSLFMFRCSVPNHLKINTLVLLQHLPRALSHVSCHSRSSCRGPSGVPRRWPWWKRLSWPYLQRGWGPPPLPAGELRLWRHTGRSRRPSSLTSPEFCCPHRSGLGEAPTPPGSLWAWHPVQIGESDAYAETHQLECQCKNDTFRLEYVFVHYCSSSNRNYGNKFWTYCTYSSHSLLKFSLSLSLFKSSYSLLSKTEQLMWELSVRGGPSESSGTVPATSRIFFRPAGGQGIIQKLATGMPH